MIKVNPFELRRISESIVFDLNGDLVLYKEAMTIINMATKLLKSVYQIKEYQDKPSIANHGRCLDECSALANYNDIADEIKQFLDKLVIE